MLGSIHNVAITEADVEELRTRVLTMPAHTDVPAGLKQLKEQDFVREIVGLVAAVLHLCIRPLIEVFCPGALSISVRLRPHWRRGFVGPSVFAGAGQTEPPSPLHSLADIGGRRR